MIFPDPVEDQLRDYLQAAAARRERPNPTVDAALADIVGLTGDPRTDREARFTIDQLYWYYLETTP